MSRTSDPATEAIGVSVAVDTTGNGDVVHRAITDVLSVWDPAGNCFVTLQPGAVLRECRVRSSVRIGPEGRSTAYVAEFEVDARTYYCPLYRFLPRTYLLESV